MKRTPLKKVSSKQTLIIATDKLLLQILFIERGKKCEICGRTTNLGLFHILVKGKYPKMRYNRQNVLIACWLPCHYYHHHDSHDPRAKRVEAYIISILGDNWESYLKALDKMQPMFSTFQISLYNVAFTQELKRLEEK